MSSSPKRPVKAHIPREVKAQIRRAIALHLRDHGDENWDLVSETPEFAGWIGKAAGETGRKRLYRWKGELSRSLGSDRTKPHENRRANENQSEWAAQTARDLAVSGTLEYPPSQAQLQAQGPTAAKLAYVLNARIRHGSEDLERLWRAAVVRDANGVAGYSVGDPKELARVMQLRFQQSALELSVQREAARITESGEFIEALVETISARLANKPEDRDLLLGDIADLKRRMGVLDSAG